MKKDIHLFISYAHRNAALAGRLMEQLSQHLGASRMFRYTWWQDSRLKSGEAWEREILRQAAACDAALLMMSPSFLGSEFIMGKELPALISQGKMLFPVALSPLDFRYHDLKGLEKMQIFFLNRPGFREPRDYTSLKPARREEFALALFRQMEDRLAGR